MIKTDAAKIAGISQTRVFGVGCGKYPVSASGWARPGNNAISDEGPRGADNEIREKRREFNNTADTRLMANKQRRSQHSSRLPAAGCLPPRCISRTDYVATQI